MLVAQSQASRTPPTFGAGTEVVRLDVLATHKGAPLLDLSPDDLEVRDRGVLQEVRVSPAASQPSDIVVLLDISQSVTGAKLEAFRACARTVADAPRQGDRAAVITFADVVALRSPFDASSAPLRRALDDLRAGGGTAMFDALFAALAVYRAGSARPLFILFTDGRDTVSWLSAEDVIAAARHSEATIYAVSSSSIGVAPRWPGQPPTWDSVATTVDDGFLRRITHETGGRLLQADSTTTLQAVLAAVLGEIATRHIVTYEPVGSGEEGWHPVEVRLKGGRGEIAVRSGYFRPAPQRRKP